MKRRDLLAGGVVAGLGLTTVGAFPARAQNIAQKTAVNEPWGKELAHLTDSNDAPVIFYTKDMTTAGLLKVYEALGQKIQGKVAVKLSIESPGGPGLEPEFLAPLCQKVKGTLVDCNGFTSPRDNLAGHMKLISQKGYDKVAPIDVLDAQGDMELPVPDGYRLTHTKTGKHFADYDTWISVVRFKAHHLPRFGGTMKNLSICLGSMGGKALIHSGGQTDQYWTGTDTQTTAESMIDAVKAALAAKRGRWAFVQVMCAHQPDDDCLGAKDLGDIGIFACLDPVALDQLACDIAYGAAPDAETKRRWEAYHSAFLPEVAAKNGVGSNRYRLMEVT